MFAHSLNIAYSTPIHELFGENDRVYVFDSEVCLKEVFHYFTVTLAELVVFVHEGDAVGLMTHKDMLRVLRQDKNLEKHAGEFMSSPLYMFEPTISIGEVLESVARTTYDKIVIQYPDSEIYAVDRRDILSYCYEQINPIIKYEYNILHNLVQLAAEGEQGLLEMATTDPLTGLGNRRFLEELYRSHQKVEEHFETSIYLLMFDIDNFKLVNDTFGHSAGDAVLKELALLVNGSIRKTDVFVRWGGEEFVILLYYNDTDTATRIAEGLRRKIDDNSFTAIIHTTCSFGLTPIIIGEALNQVIERADTALYRAKKEGKNRVCIQFPG